METIRVAITVAEDGTLTIDELPFRAGDEVEVIVRSRGYDAEGGDRYSLRGAPVRYVDPFDSVAESDWDALQ